MEKDVQRVYELRAEGKCCTQVLVCMGLALKGENNDEMVRAVSGLCGGMRSGLVCGALTGAAMMLALFDEKVAAEEMIPELVQWFQDEYGEKYGSVDCNAILEGCPENKPMRCPKLIEATYLEARQILEEFGYDIEAMVEDAF
ncbi:DVU_1555 family C-GCAxxG-C-C protein [Hominifimenecus sp. rT4P-3]|uniref:DVU_1555 family C-GCAxxG-C-C protein n=1 Tax=Hominifimenecus sp. rT4P-3 TaxID=3242979 RepID=UPI003DA32DB8